MTLSVSLIIIVCIIYLQTFLWRVFTYVTGSHIDFQKQNELLAICLEPIWLQFGLFQEIIMAVLKKEQQPSNRLNTTIKNRKWV